MTLTRARVIFATGGFGQERADAVRSVLAEPGESSAGGRRGDRRCGGSWKHRGRGIDLKRGPGGLADLEFIVQYLLLVHAPQHPELLRPNFWDALSALRRRGILSPAIHNELRDAYDFLRTVEDRLRLIHNRSVSEMPEQSRRSRAAGPPAQRRKGSGRPGGPGVPRGRGPRHAPHPGSVRANTCRPGNSSLRPSTNCDRCGTRHEWSANRRRSVVLVNVSREWRVSFRLAGDRTVQLRSSDGASRSWRRHRQLWKEGRPLPEKPQGYLVWPADRQSERTNAAISGLNGTENSPTVQIPVY